MNQVLEETHEHINIGESIPDLHEGKHFFLEIMLSMLVET